MYCFSKIGCTYSINPLGKIYNVTEHVLCAEDQEGNVSDTKVQQDFHAH